MTHLGCQTLPVFLMILLLSYLIEVIGINLNTSTSIITIGGQNNDNAPLTISCSPTSATDVLAIEIGNYNQNNVKNIIVKIVVTTTIEVADKSLEQRMTQSGSINGASGNLEMVLSELKCSDASMYYCRVTDNAATITTEEITRNVTARTYPEEITMNIYPRKTQYDVGNLVGFSCDGRIGNQFPTNMASFWVWQWRYTGSSTSNWTNYPNSNNIAYENPTVAANCQYNGRSRLFHTVTTTDNGRQFRCYVLSNTDYGDKYTIYTETPPVTGSPSGVTDAPPVTGNPSGVTDAPTVTDNPGGVSDAPPVTGDPSGVTDAPPVTDNPGGVSDAPTVTGNPSGVTHTYPEEITMNVNPRYTTYDVGNLVEFNCNGRIGNQFPTNMASFWVWQWRSVGTSASSWTTYPNSNNITYENPSVADNCQYNGLSRLFHIVTSNDNGRQFRCYVLSNTDYGDNYTINTENEPSKGIDSYSLGVGIAIGMGVMLLCGGICILIAFIYRRKVASGCVPNENPDTVIFDHRSASTTAEIESGQTAGGEYEMPGNFYDGLQGRAPDVPSTYEKLKTYQNT